MQNTATENISERVHKHETPKKRRVKESRGDRVYYAIVYFVLLLLALIVVYPLYFVVIASFSSADAVLAGKVYLVCRSGKGWLKVSIYGRESPVTYVRESVVTGTIPPPEAEIREGEEEAELRAARDGVESVGYLVRREAGKPDVRILLRKDRYAPVRGIYCVPAPKKVPQNLANSEIV